MEENKTYNGWTNYETWCVALWLDNERESYERWRCRAREFIKRAPKSFPTMFPESVPNETATNVLANRIRSELLDNTPDGFTGVYTDLLGAALSEVSWREIAAHYVDDVADEMAKELGKEKTT